MTTTRAPAPGGRTGGRARNPDPSNGSGPTPCEGLGHESAKQSDSVECNTAANVEHPDADTLRIAYVRHKSAPVHAVESLTWPALVRKLSMPTIGAKNGLGWLPAGIEPGPRQAERVESVAALVLDLEAALLRCRQDAVI